MPLYKENVGNIEMYQKKFSCLDADDMYIYGDYNSATVSMLNIQLVRCNKENNPEIECKSEEEITKFFRDKFIIVLTNEVRFDSNFYGKDSIIRMATLKWIQINT